MFPLRDNVPRVHVPIALYLLLVLNFAAFIFEQTLDIDTRNLVFYLLGVVPARYFAPQWAEAAGFPVGGVVPFFSYMFLHAGWLHVILNMWSMWIFADNVEDVMGPVRFLAFYVLCGLTALAVHMAFNLYSTAPVLGASGAIAGVMGAYLVLYPHAKVLTLVPIFIFPWFIELPALFFLGVWFLVQFTSGLVEGLAVPGAEPIAWWAHAGGFVAGIALLPLFRRRDRCYYCYNRANKTYEMVRNADAVR
jgi:membrane associated rhomboid family serine protease